MNNMQIIAQEAVASGLFTKQDIEGLLDEGRDIPFHTFSVWKSRGLVPRKGSHGWETRLWKRKVKKDGGDKNATKEDGEGFYLAKSFLFHIDQCEPIQEVRDTEGKA